MTKGEGGMEVMMGDLVLREDEVNPIMSALLENGLEVTALHNHFFWEEPRIFYMHLHGHGEAMDLAHRARRAFDLMGHVESGSRGKSKRTSESDVKVLGGKLNATRLDQIIGHTGELNGAVYKVTIGRDDLKMKEMGASINARMGLNTWAAFVGSDERAAVAGDVAMLEPELTPVLKALRKNGLEVVGIHNHMTGPQPLVIFLHYWGVGRADKLASGFRAALDELGH